MNRFKVSSNSLRFNTNVISQQTRELMNIEHCKRREQCACNELETLCASHQACYAAVRTTKPASEQVSEHDNHNHDHVHDHVLEPETLCASHRVSEEVPVEAMTFEVTDVYENKEEIIETKTMENVVDTFKKKPVRFQKVVLQAMDAFILKKKQWN